MLELTELYLYDVASPMRNEEYYIEPLESIMASHVIDDESAWLTTTVAGRWTEGWDRAQNLGTLYDLSTLPRLYLLDGEHRVILKNTTPSAIEEYFRR